MATKSYKWFFDLTENLLTKDVTNDYIATVKTLLPKTVDNLADDIVKETAYNRETVIGVIIGCGASWIVKSAAHWPIYIQAWSVFLSFAVCTVTGVFFG